MGRQNVLPEFLARYRRWTRSGAVVEYLLSGVVVFIVGLPAMNVRPFLRQIASQFARGDTRPEWLIGGIVVGAVAYLIARRFPTIRFLNTFQHESAHLFVGLCLGIPYRHFRAGESSGEVGTSSVRGPLRKARLFLTTTAPYCFSPVVLLPVLLALAFPPGPGLWLGLLGFTLGVAFTLPLTQIHPRQPDLRRYGFFPPVAAAVWIWVASVVITVPIVMRGSLAPLASTYSRAWRTLVELLT